MKKKRTLQDVLSEFTNEDDGILIRWNRQTGSYAISFHGRPMSTRSLEVLFNAVIETCKQKADKNGIIELSKHELENQKQQEEDFTPPWEN